MQKAWGDQQLDLEGIYRFASVEGCFQACVNDRKRGPKDSDSSVCGRRMR